jgi:hypothetical protein
VNLLDRRAQQLNPARLNVGGGGARGK